MKSLASRVALVKARATENWKIAAFAMRTLKQMSPQSIVLELFNNMSSYIRGMATLLVTGIVMRNIEQNTLIDLVSKYWLPAGIIALVFGLFASYIGTTISLSYELTMSRIRHHIARSIQQKISEVDLDVRLTKSFKDERRKAERCNDYDIKQTALWPIETFFGTLSTVSYIAALTWVNWQLLVLIAVITVAGILIMRKINRLNIDFELKNEYHRSVINEYAYAATWFQYQLLRFSPFFLAKADEWQSVSTEYLRQTRMMTRRIQMFLGATMATMGIYCIYLVSNTLTKKQGLAEVGIIIMSAKGVMGSLGSLVRQITSFQKDSVDIKNYLNFIQKPTGNSDKLDRPIDCVPGAKLVLEGIRFAYPANDDTPPREVLKGITVEFKPGEACVIVGPNGCGKSTLVSVICQIQRQPEGTIKLGEVHLSHYMTRRCLERVCYVPQKGDMAEIPIVESVLGMSDTKAADPERLRLALQWAGAQTIMDELPNGLSTPIGSIFENSRILSGGQEQRFRIAAFFYQALDPQDTGHHC